MPPILPGLAQKRGDTNIGALQANSLWINGLAGQWLTYVVEKKEASWEITGTTGPMAIS